MTPATPTQTDAQRVLESDHPPWKKFQYLVKISQRKHRNNQQPTPDAPLEDEIRKLAPAALEHHLLRLEFEPAQNALQRIKPDYELLDERASQLHHQLAQNTLPPQRHRQLLHELTAHVLAQASLHAQAAYHYAQAGLHTHSAILYNQALDPYHAAQQYRLENTPGRSVTELYKAPRPLTPIGHALQMAYLTHTDHPHQLAALQHLDEKLQNPPSPTDTSNIIQSANGHRIQAATATLLLQHGHPHAVPELLLHCQDLIQAAAIHLQQRNTPKALALLTILIEKEPSQALAIADLLTYTGHPGPAAPYYLQAGQPQQAAKAHLYADQPDAAVKIYLQHHLLHHGLDTLLHHGYPQHAQQLTPLTIEPNKQNGRVHAFDKGIQHPD